MTRNRMKSVIMWLGIIASAFLAVGIDWQSINTWQILLQSIIEFLNNPARIILFLVTVYSAANNPTNKSGF